MSKVYVKDAGDWHTAREIFIKDSDEWKPVKGIYTNTNGVWTQQFPSTGTVNYTAIGTLSFVVPAGVYSITATVIGGGGGGGGSYGSTISYAGGGGGSGGRITNQIIPVTPWETLTIFVGKGGEYGSASIGGTFFCTGPRGTTGTYYNGTAGESSFIKRGTTTLVEATGGSPGLGAGTTPNGVSGAGGTPNGAPGGTVSTVGNTYIRTPGGNNGSSYGFGGYSNRRYTTTPCGQFGGRGFVSISW